MSRLVVALLWVTAVTSLVLGALAGVLPRFAHADGASTRPDRLIESANCVKRRHIDKTAAAAGAADSQSVVVRIERSTFLRIDRSGHITAAATNTGCRPSIGDAVYLFRADGTISPTTTVDLGARSWVGDFTVPARFQSQPRRRHVGWAGTSWVATDG